ncbi:hypothetical protein Rhopal_002273-T1 [Rhodotorula paludigena]|uniref:ADF-H domain-containing protein n=1 Tax=Rhodotorula paludigena TaxID=86838 RepID=A0AAV5GGH7_9BASI|nr:hypothetical protein Rhopal_002273-T1 [Rhodotorula paludigena]
MADVSAPEIREAYNKVRSDKDETNWMLIDYEDDKSSKLVLTATGSGGLDEVKDKFQDDKASFAYVRVKYSNDVESFREKFILITYIGSSVKVMRRAKVSVQAADVKKTLGFYSIDVAASSKDDIKESEIVSRLRKAGGASYDRA